MGEGHDWINNVDDISIEERVILFCDAHDFSKVCVELGEGLPHFIQAFYQRVGDAIVGHGGRIVKYMGDAIFAVFDRGKEVAAVEGAISMREEYAQLLKEHSVKTESDLEVGIGSGEVAIGIFGHTSHQEEDAFGTVVNEVGKIMHHRGIAITKEVQQRIDSRYKTRRLDDVAVKWSEIPLQVWEIVGEDD
jgi:class 3 adenylate cyclase